MSEPKSKATVSVANFFKAEDFDGPPGRLSQAGMARIANAKVSPEFARRDAELSALRASESSLRSEGERLASECARLREENARLEARCDSSLLIMEKEMLAAKAERDRYREVLEYYADPNGPGEDSNFCILVDTENNENDRAVEIGDDGYTHPIGTKARAALTPPTCECHGFDAEKCPARRPQ